MVRSRISCFKRRLVFVWVVPMLLLGMYQAIVFGDVIPGTYKATLDQLENVSDKWIFYEDGTLKAKDTEFTNIKTINKVVNGFDIGDVDNDGVKELVVSVPSDEQVLVYDTQYKLKYTISFNESPTVVLISDLDDDGKNELIVGTSEGWNYGQKGYAYVGEVGNNGNFSIEWKSPAYYLRFATEFAVGDLDSDGKKELVMGLSWWDRKLVSYEYTGSTYTKIFEDNIGSDVDSVFVADNRLFVGTRCWSDYGLRVYKQYSLEFSDTGDGSTIVCVGDVNGDGVVEIIRGIGTQCGGSSSPRPSFSIYDTNYSKIFTSSELSKNNDVVVYVATGELISGNGEEIAIGTWSGATQSYPENIRIFQYNGSTYEEVWKKELSDLEEDVNYLKIADLNGDGQNELFVSTTYSLMVYAPGTVVSIFQINNGAAGTTSRKVTLNNTATDSPTHYMASESPTFKRATWKAYTEAPRFRLSASKGVKTVYFKVKNAKGESSVVNDSITLKKTRAGLQPEP